MNVSKGTLALPTAIAAGALYDNLLQEALRRFFPRATFETEAMLSASSDGRLAIEPTTDPSALTVRWFGSRHTLRVDPSEPFTKQEVRFARAIASVLAARYRAIFDPRLMAERGDLFRGAIEDRYVAAFLENTPYTIENEERRTDRIALAIEVLRVAALSSYENRPIASGVLLLDRLVDPCRPDASPPPGAHVYSQMLTSIKSFYRLADGLHTVFLVNRDGLLLDIVDVGHWASQVCGSTDIVVPCAEPFRSHARATIGSGHVCVVLSPSHEIKIFSEGMQTFTFRHANWHLLDLQAHYVRWVSAVGSVLLAERLFQTALDLSDAREGALFVVVQNAAEAIPQLVAPGDTLDAARLDGASAGSQPSRRDLLYLLANRTVMDLDYSVLAALGSMDGATVVDRTGRLLAAGAILRHPPSQELAWSHAVEGARTTAAIAASTFGPVLKVSQDGVITFLDGRTAWHM
jgi:hypothetical protein